MIQRYRHGSATGGLAWGLVLPEFRRIVVASVVLACAATAPTAAFAVSGETGNSSGTYRATSAACSQLRSKAGNLSTGAFTFACNADRSLANGREPCELVALSDDPVPGSALGFCADILPSVRIPAPDEALEKSKESLRATSFGVNTGIRPSNEDPVDVVCSTFAPGSKTIGKNAAQGVRACRQVLKCPASGCPTPPPACNDGPAGEYIRTKQDNAACEIIRAQLATSITGEAPAISHALFFSAKQNGPDNIVGKPGSQALFVCSGYTWKCGDPGLADGAGSSRVDYQIDFGVLETPGCYATRTGYRCW